MDWWWYPLIAFAGLALAAIVWLFLTRDSALVEMPGGETIYPPPEPAPPRKRWRITIERH
jgi:hypothetical protein